MYINKMDKPKHNTFTGATGRGGKQLRTECQVKCDLYHVVNLEIFTTP